MHEAGKIVFLQIPKILGIDLSITMDVVLVWLAASITFLLLFFACRRKELVAHGAYRNIFETIIEFIDKEVVEGMMGIHGNRWSPFILAIFFFILFCNLLGLVPVPGTEECPIFKPITSNINVTATMAVMVFIISQFVDIWRHGIGGYFKRVVPKGVPVWIMPLVFPLELFSRIARPVSLTLRLFANMLAGHLIIGAFIALGMAVSIRLFPIMALPLLATVLMSVFELFVCFVQAFIFTILTGFYIGEALEESH
jgi:F-type H+-transporting ATPase subunit a